MDYSYLEFENSFRGPEELVKKDFENYLPFFADKKNIADLGCGRGEFLELLRENGINGGYGVDLSAEMTEYCRGKGLTVLKEGALEHVGSLADNSIDAFFTAHMVEHIPPDKFIELIDKSITKLKPGGILLAETLNPSSVFSLGLYFMDPTHVFPVHPLTFKFFMEKSGFKDIEIIYRQHLPEDFLMLDQIIPGPEATALERAYSSTVMKLQILINSSFTNFIYAIKGKKE